MGIPSRTLPPFDISAASFTAAARDVGEVVALLSGGVRPDPDTLSRLALSMRGLQGFLIEASHEAAANAPAPSPHSYGSAWKGREEAEWARRQQVSA